MIDVAVIGGGIHGAGIAQAAVAAGYSVRVFEQYSALATGTSSRSSKLIHGGLRYLATGQFSLVRECLYERQLLLQNAPDLVRLTPFYIPVFRTSTRRPITIRAGLSLYAILGALHKDARFRSLPKAEWQDLDGLKTAGLKAVYQYLDGQTDDAALTTAVMQSAQSLGTELFLDTEVTEIRLGENSSKIVYRRAGDTNSCSATVIINAAGPWVNKVLDRVAQKIDQRHIELVQGTHIVIPGLLNKGVYYAEAPRDQRPVFFIPWKQNIMVGTTETLYQGDPAKVAPQQQEIDYLLEALQHYFPTRSVAEKDILSVFSGLRCLPAAAGSIGARARETVFLADRSDRPRVLSIYGGKLTSYRATAAQALQRCHTSLPTKEPIANTCTLKLTLPNRC